MTLSISPVTIVTNKTAAANGATAITDCASVDGSAVVALGILAQCTYHADATAGCSAYVYASPLGLDGSPWFEIQVVDIPLKAGTTKGVAFSVLPGHKYYRVRVRNLDPVQSATAIYVYAEPQVLS